MRGRNSRRDLEERDGVSADLDARDGWEDVEVRSLEARGGGWGKVAGSAVRYVYLCYIMDGQRLISPLEQSRGWEERVPKANLAKPNGLSRVSMWPQTSTHRSPTPEGTLWISRSAIAFPAI